MNTASLERLLLETAGEVAYPETPDLASAVIHRLTRDPGSARTRPRWLRPALAAAAIVIGVAFVLTFSPAARRAAADLLGIMGIQISVDGDPDLPHDVRPSTGPLDLGDEVAFGAVTKALDWPVKVPSVAATDGMETAVYFDPTIGDTGMVSMVYPRAAKTYSDVDILIGQFRASIDEGFFKKVSATGGDVTFTEVSGATGYWLSGEPHVFYYVDPNGEFREESVRLAGNVLLWERDGIAYRIEGAGSLGRALEIAHSLR